MWRALGAVALLTVVGLGAETWATRGGLGCDQTVRSFLEWDAAHLRGFATPAAAAADHLDGVAEWEVELIDPAGDAADVTAYDDAGDAFAIVRVERHGELSAASPWAVGGVETCADL